MTLRSNQRTTKTEASAENFLYFLDHRLGIQDSIEAGHRRLGDAVLAAQAKFLETGSFAELLTIYHLFGDPALQLE